MKIEMTFAGVNQTNKTLILKNKTEKVGRAVVVLGFRGGSEEYIRVY